jgi:hypothetical protein
MQPPSAVPSSSAGCFPLGLPRGTQAPHSCCGWPGPAGASGRGRSIHDGAARQGSDVVRVQGHCLVPSAVTSWRQARKPNLSARLQRPAPPCPPRPGRAHPCCSPPPWPVHGRCPGAAMLTRFQARGPLIGHAEPGQTTGTIPTRDEFSHPTQLVRLIGSPLYHPANIRFVALSWPARWAVPGRAARRRCPAGQAGGSPARRRPPTTMSSARPTARGSRSCPAAPAQRWRRRPRGRGPGRRHRRRPGHAQQARRAWRRGAL